MKKRPGECLFCGSRKCYFRIYTRLSRRGGPLYDEVACPQHTRDLELDADKRCAGVIRNHLSSSAVLRRSPALPETERRLVEIGEEMLQIAEFSHPGSRQTVRIRGTLFMVQEVEERQRAG